MPRLTQVRDAAFQVGVARGRREALEWVAGELRSLGERSRAEESQGATLLERARAALLWAVTERWAQRLDTLRASVERHAASLQATESSLKTKLDALETKGGLRGFLRRR